MFASSWSEPRREITKHSGREGWNRKEDEWFQDEQTHYISTRLPVSLFKLLFLKPLLFADFSWTDFMPLRYLLFYYVRRTISNKKNIIIILTPWRGEASFGTLSLQRMQRDNLNQKDQWGLMYSVCCWTFLPSPSLPRSRHNAHKTLSLTFPRLSGFDPITFWLMQERTSYWIMWVDSHSRLNQNCCVLFCFSSPGSNSSWFWQPVDVYYDMIGLDVDSQQELIGCEHCKALLKSFSLLFGERQP